MKKRLTAIIYTLVVLAIWMVSPFIVSWYKSITPDDVELVLPFMGGLIMFVLQIVLGFVLWIEAVSEIS